MSRACQSGDPKCPQTTMAVGVRPFPGFAKIMFFPSPNWCPQPSSKAAPNHLQIDAPSMPKWLLVCAHFWASPKTCFFHLPTGPPSLLPKLPQTISKFMPRACQSGDPKYGLNHNGCWRAPISRPRQKHAFSISQLVPPAFTQSFPKPSPNFFP